METSISRPWQGTVMGVLNSIGIAVGVMLSLTLILGASFITALIEDSAFSMVAGLGTTMIGIVLLPFLILGLFVTLGIFKGQKWAVILALVFTILGTIGNIVSFNIIGLVFNAFFIYCLVICVKDAYYN